MKRSALSLVLVLFAMGFAGGAGATIRTDVVKIRLGGSPVLATPGAIFESVLRIEAARPAVVTRLSLDSDAWMGATIDGAAIHQLAEGEVVEIPFSVLAVDPEQPLAISYEIDGVQHHRSLAIPTIETGSPRARASRETAELDASAFPGARTPTEFGPVEHDRGDAPVREGDGATRRRGRTIRVFGRVMYERIDHAAGINVRAGAFGLTVTAYDEDSTWDEELGSQVTDRDGYFDFNVNWDPCFVCDEQPDLYVEVEASNSVIQIQDATWEANYSWRGFTRNDFTGTEAYFGTIAPKKESDHPAVFMADRFMRGWYQFRDVYGYTIPDFDIQWPDGNHAYYSWLFEEIHIGGPRQWVEGTLWHEMGHHWMEHFSLYQFPDYCNGYCDEDVDSWLIPDFFEDCGHCMWCEENARDAMNEGFPNFIAWVLSDELRDSIPGGIHRGRDMEELGDCRDTSNNPCPCDPWTTEGFFSAFLQDLQDRTLNETHGVFHPEWRDCLSGLRDEIFDVQDGYIGPGGLEYHPTTPQGFIYGYRLAYPDRTTGWRGENFWETAANCGLNYDTTAPGFVPFITSDTHPVNTPVTDVRPVFRWNHASDDASGIDYYAWEVNASPTMPGSGSYLIRGDEVEVGPLDAGTWYFNIRARDRAGNYSENYVTYGPIVIREFEPGDITFGKHRDWADEVVPRPNPDATAISCPAPTQLNRAPAATFWNFRGVNIGESAVGPFPNEIYLDGVRVWNGIQAGLAPREEFAQVNLGSSSVRGGRHSLGVKLDNPGQIHEIDELNNRRVSQWVWQPDGVGPGATLSRATGPPTRSAGWENTSTIPVYPNCDGLSFQTTGGWDALILSTHDPEVDLNLNLHNPVYSPTSGFDTRRASSEEGPGKIDVVLVNGRTSGAATWYAGVTRLGDVDTGYDAYHVRAGVVAYDQPELLSLADGELAKMRRFDATSVNGEWVTIRVTCTPMREKIRIAWFGPLFVLGTLESALARAETNPQGVAELTVFSSTNASNGILIYRDPNDGPGPVEVLLDVHKTPADFTVATPAGWYAPVVPRAYHADTPTSVAFPDTLVGGGLLGPYTWFNLMIRNDGAQNVMNANSAIAVDGIAPAARHPWSIVFAGQQLVSNWSQQFVVRPGLHTISLRHDPENVFTEKSETNNGYGEQYVWGAWTQPLGSPGYVTGPPERTGGWYEVTSGQPLWYNCLGYRTPRFSSAETRWGGFAVLPRDTTDVDVRLHEVVAGTQGAFRNPLAHSSWGAGQSDFVLANFNLTPHRAFDVGIINFGGKQSFQFESVQSTYRGNATGGLQLGTFTMPSLYILQLHEVQLNPGYYSIRLTNVSGNVNWGWTLHGPESVYHSKGTSILGGASWLAPAGENEVNTASIPTAGRYCIAVWKSADADRTLEGTYALEIVANVTDAPPAGPVISRSRIASVEPNPFNPATTVYFEVSTAGRVEIDVYNLRGELIRRLVRQSFPPGRHSALWDGRDDSRSEVASGVYVFRMVNGSMIDQRKAVLVR